jgi:putative holliday junction resolvase
MRYISLDIGSKTIGVASSLGQLASSLTTIRFEHDNLASGLEKLLKQVDFSMCEKIIVGYPTHLSGQPSESSMRVDVFIEHLKEHIHCPIILVDERYSTVEASQLLSDLQMNQKKQRKIIDQMASVMILQRYLDMEGEV